MQPVWKMTIRELDAEQWKMIGAARRRGDSPPKCSRYRDIGIALQRTARLRTIATTIGVSTAGPRAAIIERIIIAKEADDFTLANDPTTHRPAQFANCEERRQRVCVEGMDCLPGQLELF